MRQAAPARFRDAGNWQPWAFAMVCVPLVLLVVETIRGAIRDVHLVGERTLQTELASTRSGALQRATGLEVLIQAQHHPERRLVEIHTDPELMAYWAGVKEAVSRQPYAAVVDGLGTIVMHTDVSQVGQRLPRGWHDRRIAEAGPNVTLTTHSPLGGGTPAYDISVPFVAGDETGEYHEGLDAAWIESQIRVKQQAVIGPWSGMLLVVLAVNAAAALALFRLARFQRGLQSSMLGFSRLRLRERAQLGSGLAHEFRNPLHALRINLHTLRRALGGRSLLPPEQLAATVDESDAAIDRLDNLLRDFLQFADPAEGQVARIDLVYEVQSTLRLLAENLRREQIEVRDDLPAEAAPIAMDPARLRQALVNLLTFAQHRCGRAGVIDIRVARQDGGVELSVGDSGPPLRAELQQRMFEPFQAPAETGTGLGLALVQAHVEEAGGWVRLGGNGEGASRCHVWFPLAHPVSNGG